MNTSEKALRWTMSGLKKLAAETIGKQIDHTIKSAEKAYIETLKELKRIEGEKEIADVVGFFSSKK